MLVIYVYLKFSLLKRNGAKTSYLDHIANTNTSMLQSNSTKLQIYLSACKLIDWILTLPSSVTAQFQM